MLAFMIFKHILLVEHVSRPISSIAFLITIMVTCNIGSTLCIGSEWHRFPSSFFVPDYVSEVRWIDDGFRGLLPFPFNSTLGGTSAAPSYFNNKNKASDQQYVINFCTLSH